MKIKRVAHNPPPSYMISVLYDLIIRFKCCFINKKKVPHRHVYRLPIITVFATLLIYVIPGLYLIASDKILESNFSINEFSTESPKTEQNINPQGLTREGGGAFRPPPPPHLGS